MGYISDHASNACIYTGYAGVLIIGLVGVYLGTNKAEFLSANGKKRGIPLSLNFVASGLGVGIISTFPQIAAQAGIHGLFVYALACAVPLLMFGALGPIIRKQLPEAFVLTEWIRHRYGQVAALMISCCTIVTIFLTMVSELASLKSCVETLTGVPGLPVLIVEAVIVSIYTSLGGFYVSFLTDNIQVLIFMSLVVLCTIAVGCTVHIDKQAVGPSRLLLENLLGWKLVYILTIALVTNDCFMAGFWMRTFAARSNRDLYIAVGTSSVVIFCVMSLLGVTGLLAVWSHVLDPNDPNFGDDSQAAFFLLMRSLPSWISGFILVFCTVLSSCAFDSYQSAMVSTISNDFCRNRVRIWWVRALTIIILVPCIVVALKSVNVLNIYLIVDILSSCVVPVMMLGLSSKFYFLTGCEIVLGIIGGILGVFIFGTIYGHSASFGGSLLVMTNGIYGNDWSAFGAFVAAPVCCVIGSLVSLFLRGIVLGIKHRKFFAVFHTDEEFVKTHDEWLFVLKKPWYEYLWLHKWGPKIDDWIFIQDGEDANDLKNGAIRFHLHGHHDHHESEKTSEETERKQGVSTVQKVIDESSDE